MSRTAHDEANDIRGFLGRMAGEAPSAVATPGRLVRRARRRLAATAVAGLAVLALAGYGAVAVIDVAQELTRPIPASTVQTPVPTPSPSATASGTYDRGSASAELSRYVLPAFSDPKVADRFGFIVGKAWRVNNVAPTFDIAVEDLLKAGIIDAYVNFWTAPAGVGDRGWRKDLLSVAMLFRDAEAARRGFALFHVKTAWQHSRWLPTRGLGEEAIAAEGRAHGRATVFYAWRVEDLVLVAVSQGSLSPEVVGSVADEMQVRVESLHPSP